MAIVQRFFPQDLRSTAGAADGNRKGYTALLLNCWRAVALFALLALILLIAAVPGWAQSTLLTGSNVLPLEGPGAGTDTVLVYASGLQGTATAMLTTDAYWITLLSTVPGYSTMNIQNGPNRLRFQFTANTGATRTANIVLQPNDGSPELTITATQAGTGFAPAGPVSLITSITGPQGIDVDFQGNLYIVDVSGTNLFEWTAANQQLIGLATGRPSNQFEDVAVDAAGDVFALENTPDGNYGTQVEQLRNPQGQSLPAGNIVFSSEVNKYEFPMGLCVDAAGQNLNVTTVDVSNKCLIDQFGTVYELDSTDANENIGSFASPPTNAEYQFPPNGRIFFPTVTGVDPCGNQQTGVSGSLYGLFKDGSGFIYFVDQNGTRLNRWDPTTPWYTCTQATNDGILIYPTVTSFTTVTNLTYPAYYGAADTMGNIYLSVMAFSLIQEIPRAYLSSVGPFNEPVGGGTDTIQVLPAAQNLTGVFAPVSSNTAWLNVTSVANGVVTFSFSPNPGPSRTATITVLGVPIQVVQAESQVPAAMTIVSGNNQQAAVGGLPFATNLLVKVVNQFGDAVANVPVTFSSPSQTIPVTTDQRGYAAATGVNASVVGPISVIASIPGTVISQTFALTGFSNGISVVSGSNQQAAITGLFGLPMTVQVLGASGQPVANVPVTFSAPTSGASGIFLSTNATTFTVNTALDGTASTYSAVGFQANTALGSYVVTASISGVPGVTYSSCVFNLTNLSLLQAGGNQTAFVNNGYASPLTLRVVDSNDNPVANVGVTFVLGTIAGLNVQGAFFSDGTTSTYVVTGADGLATSLPMTATATAGSFLATAYVNNLPSGGSLSTGWTLTNLPSTILEGALQNGTTTRTLTEPFIVKASANATAGTMVFTVVPGYTGAGGSFNGQNSVTVNLDSQGYGVSPLLTANSTPGAFTVTAYDGVTTVQSTVTTLGCRSNGQLVVRSNADYNPQIPALIVYDSLRYLLASACAGSNIDLSQIGPSTVTLQSPLRIDDNMTLTGPTSYTLTIDGASSTRLFFIGNGSVTMSNLTLQNGLAQGGSSVFGGAGAGMGGAIFMESGNVTLNNMAFKGNEAIGGGSGTAAQCTTNCIYGGGGFAGNAPTPEQGGSSGALFGVPGSSNGASGGIGGGGAGTGVLNADTSPNGGNGGFGAGGGTGRYTGGTSSSGNGGFGGGGGGGLYACTPYPGCSAQVYPGTGGYGAGNGYLPGPTTNIGFGGSGAGLGGAIFEYSGQLTLNTVQFLNNSAVGGTLSGLSGQPTVAGQGKGGAIFIYNGAILTNNGSTFGNSTNGTSNVAAGAGLPGNGNSAAPYTNGATCPGLDTVDVCGEFGKASAVTITVPAGFTFFIDGMSYTGSQTLNLAQGQYTLTAPGPQATAPGSQLVFASWSDGGAPSHTITVGSAGLSITSTFATQYLLSVSAGGTAGGGGLAFPASSGYYNAGSVVNLNAVSNMGSVFIGWTGPVAAAGSVATTVTMNAPETVMANFTRSYPVNLTVPQGLSFTVDGANYTGPQILPLAPGQHTLSTTSPQMTATGDQEAVFNSWSDGGAISHTFTSASYAQTISGSFSTQYQLIASAGSGGTISAVNGFYSSGTVVNLTATPNAGYVFHNWTGLVASPSSATTTVTMNQPATVTANFWPVPSVCVVAPANVAGWWKADATANDETTLYNAALGGDVIFAAGLVGQAFSFDGTQSPFVSVPAGVFPPQPGSGAFSFEAWFQTSGGNGGVILGQQAIAPYGALSAGWSPAIYVGTDGNLYVEMFYNGGYNQVVGSVPVNDNQWHHVGVTYDGSTEIAYLDGAKIGQTLSYTQVANGSPLSYQLGTGYGYNWPATNNGWYTFNGLIDEPTVYSRALTAAEVLSIAQAGSYGKCEPVAAVSPSTLSFPSLIDGQNATLSSQLTSSGNAALTISSIALDGGDTNFSLLSGSAGDCAVGTPVAAGGSCNIRVSFAPRAVGSLSGSVTVTDNSVYLGGTQTVQLQGAGTAGTAMQIAVASGSGQSAPTGSPFPQPLWALVTDNYGNPVQGVTVTFSAPQAGATAALNISSPSNSNGQAGVTATANGILGSYQVTATISGTSVSTTFTLTNIYNGTPPTPSVCVVAPSNVTAWWKAENNFNDVTGAYNAAAGGNVSFGNGEVGQAFSFDGSQNPYVTIPSGVFPYPAPGAFSFETWFNTTQRGVIIGLQSGNTTPYANPPTYTPGIYVGTDGKLYAQMFYNQSVQQSVSSGVVNDGNWHHVAVTYDGSTQIAYLDGAQIGLLANFTESADGSAPYQFQLGTGFTNSGWPNTNNGWLTFNGLIDEATVYARALSAAEVQGIYYAGTYGKCDPAVSLSSPLSFGSVGEGGSATMSAALSNPGNAALTISSMALDGGDTNFSLLSGSAGDCAVGAPVAAGGSCNIRVSFTPGALGSLSGSVTVMDNSLYLGGTQTVQLQGTGTVGTAKQLQITQVPAGATAGVPVGNIVAQVEDASGNVIPGSTAAVTISSSPTGINGTLTVNAVNGVATFSNLVFYAAHSYTLSVSSRGLTPAGTMLAVSPSPAGTPAVGSVSPTPASGLSNTFVLTYSDTGGNASLKTLEVDFGPEVTTANSCAVSYYPATNVLYLLNDAGTASSQITPGSGTLSNSQCSIAGSGTSVQRSGNTITLNLAVTASSTYTGVQSIFMSASDNSTATTGWLKEGTWQPAVNQPPTAVSVSPTPASGLTNTFALTYSDPNGATDLNIVKVIFGATGSLANSCVVSYSAVTNLVYLLNDAGTGSTTLTPGSGTLSNIQCSIAGSGTSVTRSGDNLTLHLEVTASSNYGGSKNIYMYASDNSGANSGWVNKGTWTPGPSQPPTVVSVNPSPATGLTNTFALMYSDPNGALDLKEVQAIFGSNTSEAYTCSILYYPATNALYLVSDAGSGSTNLTPGSGTLSNSQCSISGSGTTVVRSGDSLTLNVAVTASATYTGVHSIFMNATNKSSMSSGWVNKGTWTPAANQPPVVVSVSPSAATGLSNTFELTYSDPNGAPDLKVVGVILHTTVSLANSCAVEYHPTSNVLYLYNDAGTGTTSTTLGSGTLSNSQCTISGSGSSVARSGETLTLNLAVTASPTYTGQQYVFLYAEDNSLASTGWTNRGTWAP